MAGDGPGALTAADARKESFEPVLASSKADAGRRAESRAVHGAGTASRRDASSRQPDQDGPDVDDGSSPPWQSPASQQSIFTRQWQRCASVAGAENLARAERGRSNVAARTARSAPAQCRDLLLGMTGPF